MTDIATLKLQQENLGLKVEILALRSRVNEMTIDVIRRGIAELDGAIKQAEAAQAAEAAKVEANPVEVKPGLNDPEE